jgi:hypothetical protein
MAEDLKVGEEEEKEVFRIWEAVAEVAEIKVVVLVPADIASVQNAEKKCHIKEVKVVRLLNVPNVDIQWFEMNWLGRKIIDKYNQKSHYFICSMVKLYNYTRFCYGFFRNLKG